MNSKRLKELLRYDPQTGEFFWRVRTGRALIGMRAGCVHHDGYRVICIQGKLYYDGRLAWLYVYGHFPKEHIDHKNRDKLDCRIANLREATDRQSLANRKIMGNSRNGFKGIQKSRNKWVARIWSNGARLYLGTFATPEAAHAAYRAAAKKLHGEYFHGG
jgi:hypothetical protein